MYRQQGVIPRCRHTIQQASLAAVKQGTVDIIALSVSKTAPAQLLSRQARRGAGALPEGVEVSKQGAQQLWEQ
jgi:hypothetical protein